MLLDLIGQCRLTDLNINTKEVHTPSQTTVIDVYQKLDQQRSSYMLKVSTKSLYKLHGLDGDQRKKFIHNPGVFHDF